MLKGDKKDGGGGGDDDDDNNNNNNNNLSTLSHSWSCRGVELGAGRTLP
jgi:hypothetical protein